MIRPHGPNCWTGLGAFNERVLLKHSKRQRSRSVGVRRMDGQQYTSARRLQVYVVHRSI